MKTTLLSLMLAGLMPVSGMAQSASGTDRRNELKINLPSLAVKTFSMQYERGLSGSFSTALGLRFGPETGVPFRNLFTNSLNDTANQTANLAINSLRTSNFAITPEVRYYFSGTSDHGFYTALFGRYATSGLSSSFQTQDDAFPNGLRPVQASGRYRSGGIGLLAGVKWRIRDRVSIDWWIAGPMYVSGTVRIDVNTDMTSLDADQRAQIRSDIEKGIEIGGQQLNGTVDFRDNGFAIEAPLSMLQLRTGLAIGIAF
ncbi:MAG: DUF3575 domain-containing protein [Sphingobacteriales bacterium]|nr:MAG: DUF3575 domain-containing protein [Sphingobacteriales bacterium]